MAFGMAFSSLHYAIKYSFLSAEGGLLLRSGPKRDRNWWWVYCGPQKATSRLMLLSGGAGTLPSGARIMQKNSRRTWAIFERQPCSIDVTALSIAKRRVRTTIRSRLATRLLWFIRRTEVIVVEDRLTLSGVRWYRWWSPPTWGNHYDVPTFWFLHCSRVRSVLGQRQM